MDIGFLNHGGESLFRHAPRLQKGREVAALPELGDVQFDGSGPRLPVPVAVAVALVDPLGTAFAGCCTRQMLNLQRHQTLGGKADHLPQQIGV